MCGRFQVQFPRTTCFSPSYVCQQLRGMAGKGQFGMLSRKGRGYWRYAVS